MVQWPVSVPVPCFSGSGGGKCRSHAHLYEKLGKRHNLLLATLARLFALLAIGGMVVVCIATGAWLVHLWKVLPLLNDFFPGMSVQLQLGFVMMVVAIVTALVALVRSTVTLKAVSAAPDNTSSLPQRDRTGPKDWIIVLPALLFVFIELLPELLPLHFPFGLLFVARMLMLPPLFVLGSMMFAHAVKEQRLKVADFLKQEPLQQVQQVHEQG